MDLLYVQEHLSCANYRADVETGFSFYLLEEKQKFQISKNASINSLVFLLEGSLQIDCDEFLNRTLNQHEFILIQQSADATIQAAAKSKVLLFTFNYLKSICDKLYFNQLWELSKKMVYDFTPTPIRQPLTDFISLMDFYLENKMSCIHLHEIKHQELFLVLRGYYTKEQLANLFYPILGKSIYFRNLILSNYRATSQVNELAQLVGMGRSAFDAKFKEEFNMPPHQWLLSQKAKHIQHRLSDPECTISDILIEFKFNSSTHFNRFCNQQFGCNPTDLIKKLRKSPDLVE